jgi:hypothetical protein
VVLTLHPSLAWLCGRRWTLTNSSLASYHPFSIHAPACFCADGTTCRPIACGSAYFISHDSIRIVALLGLLEPEKGEDRFRVDDAA